MKLSVWMHGWLWTRCMLCLVCLRMTRHRRVNRSRRGLLLRQQLSNSYRRDLAWRPLCDSNTVVVMKQLLLSKKRVVEPIIIINTAGRLSREHHRCGRASLSILSRPPRSTQSIAFSFVYLSSILLAFVVMTVIRLILLFVQLHLHFRLEHFIVSNIVVFVTSTMQHE